MSQGPWFTLKNVFDTDRLCAFPCFPFPALKKWIFSAFEKLIFFQSDTVRLSRQLKKKKKEEVILCLFCILAMKGVNKVGIVFLAM